MKAGWMSFVILNRSPQTIHQDVLQKIVLVVGSLHGADGLVGTSESKDITILEALVRETVVALDHAHLLDEEVTLVKILHLDVHQILQ